MPWRRAVATALRLLTYGSIWKSVISFTPWLLYSRYPLNGSLDEPVAGTVAVARVKLPAHDGNRTLFVQPVASQFSGSFISWHFFTDLVRAVKSRH
jgi:hypothetical protein